MPYQSDHFTPAERECHVPPWGVEQKKNGGDGPLTTNSWVYRGLQGLPAQPLRNNTTNHFDPQNWRSRSDYREKFNTPPSYSRHGLNNKASPFRNHKPHASIEWPLEPNKSYMIWKTKKPLDAEELKAYSAPSMLRHFKENKWRTTNQSTYQNYFQGNKMAAKSLKDGVREEVGTGSSQRVSQENCSRESGSRGVLSEAHQRATAPGLRTMYKGAFNGEKGKPSTSERPADHSWRNIKY